jgi:beta-galactosidase
LSAIAEDSYLPSEFDITPFLKQGENLQALKVQYAHSMGNSTGNLFKFWNAIREHKRMIGSYIWDWIDQGLVTKPWKL